MFKQIIAIVLFSVGIILAMPYAQQGLSWLLSAHDWVSDILTDVFSDGNTGNILRQLIALLAVPILVGLVPAIIYWVIRHTWFPYFMQLVWIIWLVQTAALVVLAKA